MREPDFGHRVFVLLFTWAVIILILWFLFGYLHIGAGQLNDFNG